MTRTDRIAIGVAAIAASVAHVASDALEWAAGFSPAQLWINYAAFVLMPMVTLGLYAAQRPAIAASALGGAALYAAAFVYFAHTALVALATAAPDYAALLDDLGATYTVHGALMVVGGLWLAAASARARVLPRGAIALFAGGIAVNLACALLPVPAIAQTVGSLLRNAGLVGLGLALVRTSDRARAPDRGA